MIKMLRKLPRGYAKIMVSMTLNRSERDWLCDIIRTSNPWNGVDAYYILSRVEKAKER